MDIIWVARLEWLDAVGAVVSKTPHLVWELTSSCSPMPSSQ